MFSGNDGSGVVHDRTVPSPLSAFMPGNCLRVVIMASGRRVAAMMLPMAV